MIGLNPKPFIFVHIPKCAGTSIEKALIPLLGDYQDFYDFSEQERSRFWLPGSRGLQHSKLRRYEQHFELGEYFKFAFVRNPWDRAISQISYLRNRTGTSFFSGQNFKENLRIYCDIKENIQAHDLGACQLEYLLDRSGAMRMELVCRFESLREDFGRACALLGMPGAPYLPYIFNSRRSRHYSCFYDDESAGWIRKRFARDIEFFDYKFETVAENHATEHAARCSAAAGGEPV